MRCKKPVVVEAFRATEDNIAEAGAHRGRPAGRGGDGIMIDPHTRLGVEVWLLHDSGMPLSEIARELSRDVDEIRAVITEIWSEGMVAWRNMVGLERGR